jgi:uncharacterized protein
MMSSDPSGNRAVWLFVGIAYGLSTVLSLIIGFTGGPQSRLLGIGYLSMAIPTIAVIITSTATRQHAQDLGWTRFPLRYLPVALLLMPAVLHAVMLPAAAVVGGFSWQDWLTPDIHGLYHAPDSRGWGVLTAHALVSRVVVNALVGLAAVSILACLEEVGWRAWLLPRLEPRFGPRRAVVVIGLLWAGWHVPFIVGGIMRLEGLSVWLTAVIMPPGIMGAGLVLGWLWLQTRSIWMVSLAHGALNNWGQYAFKFMTGPGRWTEGLVLGAGNLAVLVVGVLLLVSVRPAVLARSSGRSGSSVA